MSITDLLFGTIITNGTITGSSFLIATVCSLVIGIFIAFMYTIKNNYSKSYIITLALLPAIVQMVIMMVNGNIGAGVAVEIYTPRYACRLAFADVFLPVCVVLFGDILAEAGADHDEIITRVLDFFNADLAVVGADINALAVFEVSHLYLLFWLRRRP